MADTAAALERVRDEDEDNIGCVLIRGADRDALLARIVDLEEALRDYFALHHLENPAARTHALGRFHGRARELLPERRTLLEKRSSCPD